MKKIIGIGNALTDVLAVIRDEEMLQQLGLPKGSMQLIDKEKFNYINQLFGSMETTQATGGSAGNTIKALACLDTQPGFIGKVGDDYFGKVFAEQCKTAGVKAALSISSEPSGVASTFITPDSERTFATFLGAASTLNGDDITEDTLKGYDYLYIEGYLTTDHLLVKKLTSMAHRLGMKTILDLASYNVVAADLDFFRNWVNEEIDIVFANEEECLAFTGLHPNEAIHHLADCCDVAIVKLGKHGVLVARGDERIFEKPMDVPTGQVKDTTGAGDYFAAGFLYAYAQDAPLNVCAQAGSLLSGHVIQHIGATLSPSVWKEIKLKMDSIMHQ